MYILRSPQEVCVFVLLLFFLNIKSLKSGRGREVCWCWVSDSVAALLMALPVSRPVPHGHKMAAVSQHLFLQLRLRTQELTLDNVFQCREARRKVIWMQLVLGALTHSVYPSDKPNHCFIQKLVRRIHGRKMPFYKNNSTINIQK